MLYLNNLFSISNFRRSISIYLCINTPLNVFILPEEFSLDLETTDFPSIFSTVEDTEEDNCVDAAIDC